MGEKRNWNNNFTVNHREKLKRDPLYQCDYGILYTQEVRNGLLADINSSPVKADRYGVFHGVSL